MTSNKEYSSVHKRKRKSSSRLRIKLNCSTLCFIVRS